MKAKASEPFPGRQRAAPGAHLRIGLAAACLLFLVSAPAAVADGSGKDAAASEADEVVFRDPLTNEPFELERPEGEARTEATDHFHEVGHNLYLEEEDEEAINEGADLFAQWCASCHGSEGGGGMGPSLVDEQYRYERTDTTLGAFEIVHRGGAGAMQSFASRLTQDEMLRILAYVERLGQE